MQTLNRPNSHTLAYQSRVGPVEWLQPYTDDAIRELGTKGVKDLAIVPISFVSEHIETLQEIDIEYREIAEESGIENFYRVPAPNLQPLFIQALAELVLDSLEKPSLKLSQVTQMKKNLRMYPQERWEWGITISAEIWNGRLAMLGFIALVIELITGQGLLHLIGIL
jgi:ferrochelatase